MQSNDMTVLPGDSNKEYTFIFRGGDSSHGNNSYGCYIYDGTTLVDSFENNAVLANQTSYILNFNMWNEYPGGRKKPILLMIHGITVLIMNI